MGRAGPSRAGFRPIDDWVPGRILIDPGPPMGQLIFRLSQPSDPHIYCTLILDYSLLIAPHSSPYKSYSAIECLVIRKTLPLPDSLLFLILEIDRPQYIARYYRLLLASLGVLPYADPPASTNSNLRFHKQCKHISRLSVKARVACEAETKT